MAGINESIKERAVKEYSKPGTTFRSVGEMFDVTGETVRNWVNKSLSPNPKRHSRERIVNKERNRMIKLPKEMDFNANQRWTAEEDDLMIEGLKTGLTAKELSELLGRTVKAICTHKWVLIGNGEVDNEERFVSPTTNTGRKIVTDRAPRRKRHEGIEDGTAKELFNEECNAEVNAMMDEVNAMMDIEAELEAIDKMFEDEITSFGAMDPQELTSVVNELAVIVKDQDVKITISVDGFVINITK
jgi:transposase-like protein